MHIIINAMTNIDIRKANMDDIFYNRSVNKEIETQETQKITY